LKRHKVFEVENKDQDNIDIMTSKLFDEWHKFMKKNIVSNPDSTPKFIWYSGHDTNLRALSAQIADPDDISRYLDLSQVPFASVYTFHVIQNDESGQYSIRAFLNDIPIHLKWCNKEYECHYDIFMREMEKHLVDRVKLCQKQG